jgi:hypothetical protein
MARKTIEEQIKALEEKEQSLKAQKMQLQAKQREQEKKARTHRLIEVGGAVESVLGRPIEKEEIPKLIAFLKAQEDRGQFLSKALNENTRK